ncbi:TPA_asm: LO7 [Tilapia adomavirus 1]|uniref:LO7 n=1 Tax=Tilapia adomavirus 1 TaxID=2597803 RepID=A0A5H3CW04_9VIRU|nr:TPA_asm: LO7 [Tilapia adomavirus 1]
MTTTDENASFDTDLSLTLQENQKEYHIAGSMTTAVHTREATCVGPNPVHQLNQRGTSDIIMELECPKDEAILVGSIYFIAEGKVRVNANADQALVAAWGTAQANGGTHFQTVANGNSPLAIPPFVVNSQLTQIDFEVGTTQSINRHLSQVSSSEYGAGVLSAMQAYWNETQEFGYYCLNSSNSTLMTPRHQNSVAAHTDRFRIQERVHHQINIPFNLLSSWDYDDHNVRKVLPRGMSLKMRAATRPYTERAKLARTNDNNHSAHIEWTQLTVKYNTVVIPDGGHRQNEPSETVLATLDMGVKTHDLLQNTPRANVPITFGGTEFVPQWVIMYVAPGNCFDLEQLRDNMHGLVCIPNAIKSIRCNLQGDLTPDFMMLYQDATIALQDMEQRTAMYNAFLGRVGFLPGRSRKYERSPAEVHILSYGGQGQVDANMRQKVACSAAVILTDPSMALVREASSGALTGKLSVKVEFNHDQIAQGCKLVVLCITKQQIIFSKVKELPGASPIYVLNKLGTRPAFTQVDVVSPSEDDVM